MKLERLIILFAVAAAVLSLTVPADPEVPSKSGGCYTASAFDVLLMVDDQPDIESSPEMDPKKLITDILPELAKISQRFPQSRFSLALLGDGIRSTQPFFTLRSSLQSYPDFEKVAKAAQVDHNYTSPMKDRYTISPFLYGFEISQVGWKSATAVDKVLRTKVLIRVTDAPGIEADENDNAIVLCEPHESISCPKIEIFHPTPKDFTQENDGVLAIVITASADFATPWSKVMAEHFTHSKVFTTADGLDGMDAFLANPEDHFTNACTRESNLNGSTPAPNATLVSHAAHVTVKVLATTSLLAAAAVY